MRRLRSIAGLALIAFAACVTVQVERDSLERSAEVATFQQDWTRAADLWYRVWRIDEGRGARSSYETARALFECGDPRGALAVAKAGLVHLPDDAPLHELAGRAALAIDDREEAALAFEHALEHEPGRFSSMKALGSLRYELGEYTAAAEVLERAHAAEPGDSEVALLLAASLEEGGHSLLALAAYESGLREIDATTAQLWHAARLGFGTVDAPACPRGYEAVVTDWLQRLCALDPQAVEAHLVLGRLDLANGRDADAVRRFERVVELEPTHAGALEALTRALIATGDEERARDIALFALETVSDEERATFEELLDGDGPTGAGPDVAPGASEHEAH